MSATPTAASALRDDTFGHPLMAAELQPAAIHHNEFMVAVFRTREIQIAGSAWNPAGNRAPALGDPIEQRRLACVCTSDQHNGGKTLGRNPPRLGARCIARIRHDPNSASLRGSRVQSRSTLTTISKNTRAPRIFLEFEPRQCANFFEGAAAGANQHAFVRLAINYHSRADPFELAFLIVFEFLDLDRG